MECKNGDDSTGARVASWAADGGVGGLAGKTVNDKYWLGALIGIA